MVEYPTERLRGTTVDQTHDILEFLSGSDAFRELSSSVLERLSQCVTTRSFEAGELLMQQGRPGDCLLVVVDGRASAWVTDHQRTRHRAGSFGPHDVVGEMALLTDQPRTADVIADEAGRAFAISADDFGRIALAAPELGVVLTNLVALRLGQRDVDGLGGKVVDRYRIHRCIGRGAMAVVYEARDTDTDERVALKMMSHRLIYEPGAMARFEREASLLLDLEHPNIARVLRRFEAYRTAFMVMEFCDGADLSQLLARVGQLGEQQARHAIGQVANGVAHMHARNIIHRDLKPQNVLATSDGTLKLTDLGLAKPPASPGIDSALTVPGAILGTPLYMAPEQLGGAEPTAACDLYALGCIGWQLLTGALPFAGRDFFELADAKRSFRLPKRREIACGVSRQTYTFLKRCLAPDPRKRKVDIAAIAGWAGPVTIGSCN